VRPSLLGCQLWLTFEQFMGSCNYIHGNMTVDFVLISNPENMPELHVVNCGHSTPCTDCAARTFRMEINCDLSARGLAEIDEQTNGAKLSRCSILSQEGDIVHCHVILLIMLLSSCLFLKI